MKLRHFFIILFFSSSSISSSQNITLSFSSNNISLPDTIDMGDTIWYNFWVINDGNSVITDCIDLKTARFCQAQGMIHERKIGKVSPGALFPGDSIEFSVLLSHEVVNQQNYLTGDNIVVIWPRVQVSGSQANEHLTTQIHVLNNSMISSLNEDATTIKDNIIYFSDKTIHFLSKFSVSEVFLYDMLGNKVYHSNFQLLTKINLQNIPSGTYLMVLRLKGGAIRKEKIIVQ